MKSQAGAICLVDGQVVLVRNSNDTRWVIPKGSLEADDPDLKHRAVQEVWEEAGVRGFTHPEPLGYFAYRKSGGVCLVTVFLMTECELSESWPESGVRTRLLRSPKEARDMVDEPGLKDILDQVGSYAP